MLNETEKLLIRNELQVIAQQAGIVDVAAVDLMDFNNVHLTSDLKILGADAAVAEFKARKPNLFVPERTKQSTTKKYDGVKPGGTEHQQAKNAWQGEFEGGSRDGLRNSTGVEIRSEEHQKLKDAWRDSYC